ncbi:MAG TPA: glycosyl hydrolase family 8 [Solirubrobacterales bacterium]|nr:glycosyl hydrolase family 8 [Solirubrobacterales bacterium]
MRRRRVLFTAAGLSGVAALAVLVGLVRGDCAAGQSSGESQGSEATASAATSAFLDRYVRSNGRVSRIDQGGDTVSEGQAYAMLLAAAQRRSRVFAKVWTWTREHLRRPDGLLSWHWEHGRVVASDSAADGDLDAAWALLLGSERLGVPAYRTEALELAHAILEHETVSLDGRSLLVAGNWATTFPAVVDPSYFTPRAFAALGRASGDPRWGQLESTSHQVLRELTARPTGLAPDWAVVEPNGEAKPTPAPGQGGEATFGYDAVRVPLWQAQSCAGRNASIAGRMEPFFYEKVASSPSSIYSLEGEPRSGPPGAPMLVAAAAASFGAGDGAAAANWLDGAEADVEAEPTYYGMALLALARSSFERKGGLRC